MSSKQLVRRCVMVAALWAAAAVGAWAQEVGGQDAGTLLGRAEAAARQQAAYEATESAAAPAAQQRPRQAPALAMPKPRLAGSATGYVENAFVGNQFRFRFDSGGGIATPDRAEFFYAKCGCYKLAGVDPDAPGPVGVLPAGAVAAFTPLIEYDLDYRDYQLYAELAAGDRFSLFVDAPIRSLSPTVIPEATGFGDMKAGMKLGLAASSTTAVTLQAKAYLPTGDSEKGLGTAHPSLEVGLLLAHVVDRVSLSGEFSAIYPINGSNGIPASTDKDWAGNVLRYGGGIGIDLVGGQKSFGFAPVAEVVAWHVLGGYASVTPDGTPAKLAVVPSEGLDIVNLKLGARLTFNGRHSVYAGYGFPLSDNHWYDDIVRVEYRLAF